MIERWRTTTTLVYIAVLWSCICCDSVCFAVGFKSLVADYFNVHQLSNSSCPIEVSLQFDHELSHRIPLSSTNSLPNSTHHQSSSIGNCTNNLTAADSLRHPPPTTSADSAEKEGPGQNVPEEQHQPIVTFDEWTKEKLKQEHRKPPPPVTETGAPSARAQQLAPGAAATRNYASKECGAKVLLSNPEAENTKAILNEKEKDEYMRNPCEKAENKFVIIELCETVQPHSIELANYELFSSGPKTIRLWSAERFPNGEWKLLSELTAADSRQSQQFHIPTNGAYVKFMKVELISHYGNEHYCTLSVLKILGISMVDEYEAEAEAASVAHTRNNVESSETKTNVTSTEGTDNVSTVTFTPASSAASQLAQTQENGASLEDTKSSEVKEGTSESKPTVIEIVDEVSGRLIKKFVDVMKDNFGGVNGPKERQHRETALPSAFMACYFCPKDGSYIYPRQFCQAFVWKAPLQLSSKREVMPHNGQGLAARLGLTSTSRSRRSRYAFLQRKSVQRRRATAAIVNPNQQQSPMDNGKQQEPLSLKVAPDVQQNVKPALPIPLDSWPASSTSHKESVFMKLNKRIAALELNMSLSSEYLSELSRQYVAQSDEHQKHMKQARKVVEQAVETIYARVNETLASKIALLRKEVDTLSNWLSSMRATASRMTVSRFTMDAGTPLNEKCLPQQTDLHHYSPPDDGLWTTEQVVYMVVCTQLTTVLILGMLSLCYQRFTNSRNLSEDQRAQVEELINERVAETLERNYPVVQRYTKQKLHRVKQRASPHIEDLSSLRADESAGFTAECTSSSRTTNSDESSTEDLATTSERLLLSTERRAIIASVALLA